MVEFEIIVEVLEGSFNIKLVPTAVNSKIKVIFITKLQQMPTEPLID